VFDERFRPGCHSVFVEIQRRARPGTDESDVVSECFSKPLCSSDDVFRSLGEGGRQLTANQLKFPPMKRGAFTKLARLVDQAKRALIRRHHHLLKKSA
jgi:hypothetical protein